MTQQAATVATPVQSGAGWLGAGIPVTIVGGAVLLASAYAGLTHPDGGGSSIGLAWLGWLAVLGGSAMIGVGVFYLAQHADRAAGYRVPPPPFTPTTLLQGNAPRSQDDEG